MYLLLDYGNFTDGRASNTSSPYVQLLSTTDPAEAHSDFVATRLNGKDTTGSQHYGTGSEKSFFQRHTIPIIAAALVGSGVALAGVLWLVATRRKRVYRPLPYPAPAVDMPILVVAGYGAGQQEPYYPDSWSSWR